MRVLGIDTGLAICGWSIIDKHNATSSGLQYIACGVITTDKADEAPLRLYELDRQLSKLIEEYQPQAAAVEELFFFKNAKTVIGVAQARGVILSVLQRYNIAIAEYTPLEVKQAVTGAGRAEKQQVQQMVKALLKLTDIPKPDDAADAVAIAIKHCFASPLTSSHWKI